MPKISIIVPLYNHAKELVKCLESIKKQTCQDYEVIVVNDGSTDVMDEQLRATVKYQMPVPSDAEGSNIKYLFQSNQGAPTARNNGFAQSTGRYIIFGDADVVMRPDMLAKMVKVLDENPQISYVYSSFKFSWKKFKLWPFDAERLKQMPYIHTTSLIRREHFPGFDPSLKRLQDWDLWLTMLEHGHVGQWIPECLFIIRGKGTMSHWFPKIFFKSPLAPKGIKDKIALFGEARAVIKAKHGI